MRMDPDGVEQSLHELPHVGVASRGNVMCGPVTPANQCVRREGQASHELQGQTCSGPSPGPETSIGRMGVHAGSTSSSQDSCSSPETVSAGNFQDHKERSGTSKPGQSKRAKSESDAQSELHPELSRRPLGGKSKEILMRQIELLHEEQAALRLQIRSVLRGQERKHEPPANEPSTQGQGGVQQHRRPLPNPRDANRSISSTMHDGADFPSTFASQDDNATGDEAEYLEEIVSLAGALRNVLLSGKTDHKADEKVLDLLEKPGLREVLTDATPHPERADAYAQSFAKRSLELYKIPEHRSAMMRAGPLQQAFKHPAYVDILMKCVREPYIAHMGTFDETLFGLCLVLQVEFHATKPNQGKDESDELDDSNYEFSSKFFEQFPFVGTKQLIEHSNVFRRARGEEPIVQTREMAEAEAYTYSRQMQASRLPKQ